MALLIGFGHKRLRGKDTACNYILAQNLGFRRDCFAHSLKEGIGRGVFGLTDEQLYGDLKEVIDPFWEMTPREILQKAGTEAMRHVFGEDIWVKTLLRRFEQHGQNTVVSDVRFFSEVFAIKGAGGYVINVARQIPHDESKDTHQSEVELDSFTGWDYVIHNNGTKDELFVELERILGEIHHG